MKVLFLTIQTTVYSDVVHVLVFFFYCAYNVMIKLPIFASIKFRDPITCKEAVG